MKLYSASFDIIVWRIYAMMVMVLIPFFIGIPILSILALPIFISALLGVSFTHKMDNEGKSKNIYPDTEPDSTYLKAA